MFNIEILDLIATAIADENGMPYYVGGCVRDKLLGQTPKDFDLEVFYMQPDRLKQILSRFGTVDEVGKSFGVLILSLHNGLKVEFTTPRRENKEGRGHKGFLVELDPNMTLREAASRRDFSMNAIYAEALSGAIHDPFDGRTDVKLGFLDPVGESFGEDPLRVLRGMQFAGRFDGLATGPCIVACQEVKGEYDSLPKERIWKEWWKWATLSTKPSAGIVFLASVDWIGHYPALTDMVGVPQNPEYHPEGDVYSHVLFVCDSANDIAVRDGLTGEDRAVLLFAALCHDMGKPSTTVWQREAWRSPGHDTAGVPIAREFLESIGCPEKIIGRVLPLIAEHMFPVWTAINRRMVRRLKLRLEPCGIHDLLRIMEADTSGRPPFPKGLPKGADKLIALNQELPPKIEPTVTGRHIMELGVKDGKTIGEIKRRVFEAQLNEEFDAADLVAALAHTELLIRAEYHHAVQATDD